MNDLLPSPSAPRRLGLAVWSLACGVLAIVLSAVCIGPLFAIPAVICGHMAFSRIRRSGGALTGEGLALGGLITGYISIALLPVILLLAAIAIPNFVRAKQTSQRNLCINNLRQIDAAKQAWGLDTRARAGSIPTQSDLIPYLRMPSGMFPTCPAGGTYTLGEMQTDPTCSIPGHRLNN